VLARLVEEGAERGMLGSLKGAAGDWEKVVKAYEYHREWRASQGGGLHGCSGLAASLPCTECSGL
jgi:hypothetical protein